MVKDKRLIRRDPRRIPRDILAVEVPKGKKDAYKQAAAELGLSLSMLIQSGVEEFIRNHADEDFIATVKAEKKLSAESRRLMEAFNTLPKESRTLVRKLLEDFASKLSALKNI